MDKQQQQAVARVMVRCKGYSRKMGEAFALTLTAEEAKAIAALEVEILDPKTKKVSGYGVVPFAGPKLAALLDEVADRKAQEEAAQKTAEDAEADRDEGEIDTDLE